MIGGPVTSTLLALEVIPLLYATWRTRQLAAARDSTQPPPAMTGVQFDAPLDVLHNGAANVVIHLAADIHETLIHAPLDAGSAVRQHEKGS